MATYTPARAARPRVAPSRDLTHPLDRLKGIIRRFVAYDVALFVGLFLTLWFWVGVGVDYGLFKATGLDLARDLTPAVRIGAALVLFVTLVALVVWRITVLVNKDLSLTALALVLEKRHPKLLGDRLITAIEMADVERASREGYSADMVRHTIEEARERMRQVNVRSVFAWGRLWWKGGMIVGVWVLAVLLALGVHVLGTGKVDPARGFKKLADVCGIFSERNFLFQPTPWPRQVQIEITDFDDDGHPGELRIGKGTPTPPKVTARVVKWVVADDARVNPDGWRAMTVADLKAYGIPTPAGAEGDDQRIDDLERQQGWTDDDPTHQALVKAADDMNNTRKLRKLDVPDKLKLRYDGLQSRSRTLADLTPDASGKYTGEVANLTESVRFTVSAEDFTTARRQITLVPPPTLIDLYRDEYQPAYLHFANPLLTDAEKQQLRERLQIDNPNPLYALRGRTVKLPNRKVSITSDKSSFAVPVGTELHLTAEADKDLKSIEIRPVGPNPLAVPEFHSAEAKAERRDARTGAITDETFVPLTITRPDGAKETRLEVARGDAAGLTVAEADFEGRKLAVRRFTLKFEGKRAVRQLDKPTEFQLVMTDTDNVTSIRTIAITATDDAPPQVEVLVDPIIRRVGGAYMVTPVARIPFLPDSKISDPEGLSSVRFEFKKQEEEARALVEMRGMAAAALVANSVAPLPSWGMPATVLHSQTNFDMIFASTIPQTDSSGNTRLPGIDVPRFEDELKNLQRQTLEQVIGATALRADSDLADALVKAELTSQKVNVSDMAPDEFAKRKAEVLARLRADRKELPPDRGQQTVKMIKLSDATGKGDGFDLQANMPELPAKGDAIQKRYKIELFVVAKDVNVELTGKDGKPAEPKSARNLEPIRLLVVSKPELLVEIGKDEEAQLPHMEEVMKKGGDGKVKLDREFNLVRALPAADEKARKEQLLTSQVRLTDITQDLAKVREVLTAMRAEYEKLYREMDANRFDAENMYKYRNPQGTNEELMTGFLDLIGLIVDENRVLAKAEKSTEAVRATLANSQVPTEAALAEATNDYVALLRMLTRLDDQHRARKDKDYAIKLLQGIINTQERLIREEIKKTIDELREKIRRPVVILPKEFPKVAAGKTVKVKLGVRWQLYPETSLFIGIEPPATAGLKVPDGLAVKSKGDEDVTEVEFEITGGTKPGVYTITLRPATYKPLELTVEVTK